MEGNSDFTVTGLVYNEVGNVQEEYLPKTSNTLDFEAVSPSDPKTSYTYDDLHRLTDAIITNTADNDDYTRTYSYSPNGNMMGKSDESSHTSHKGDKWKVFKGNKTKGGTKNTNKQSGNRKSVDKDGNVVGD